MNNDWFMVRCKNCGSEDVKVTYDREYEKLSNGDIVEYSGDIVFECMDCGSEDRMLWYELPSQGNIPVEKCWRKGGCPFNSNNSLRYMKCKSAKYSVEQCLKDNSIRPSEGE